MASSLDQTEPLANSLQHVTLCLSWPTQYLPLAIGQLNTSIQVNNMAMLHLIYNSHTYLHYIYITIHSFLHTSSTLVGRPDSPDSSCREQVKYINRIWNKWHNLQWNLHEIIKIFKANLERK
jgi:hypothetical protein